MKVLSSQAKNKMHLSHYRKAAFFVEHSLWPGDDKRQSSSNATTY
jgi:hypothetical protein